MFRFSPLLVCMTAMGLLAAGCSGAQAPPSAEPAVTTQIAAGPPAQTAGKTTAGTAASSGAAVPGGQTMDASRVDRPAPAFTLTDQFGQRVSLKSLRGKVVLLAFIDSQCTGICPMTTEALVGAVRRLGPAAKDVQLIAVDANPQALSVADVKHYSEIHGVLHDWLFLTGTESALSQVWKNYGIVDYTQQGRVIHTSAVYVIDAQGNERDVYLSSQLYSDVRAEAVGFAQAAAQLMGGSVVVDTSQGYKAMAATSPTQTVLVPALLSGVPSLHLGPGQPHLILFFASWIPNMAKDLKALDAYNQAAAAKGLPQAVAVDIQTVEPSPQAAEQAVSGISQSLHYPVGVDVTGALADGYGVNADLPWLTMTSASGRLIWGHDGFLAPAALEQDVQAALAHP